MRSEAVQWTYFAYLAAIKEQNGAAMSLGRVSTFLDIYIERDLKSGKLTEAQAQELIDDFVMKLRMARHLRTPEYNELFARRPHVDHRIASAAWARTAEPSSPRTSFRILNTLYTLRLRARAQPDRAVVSNRLPEGFKRFCAKVSMRYRLAFSMKTTI